LPNKLIDVGLPIAKVSALYIVLEFANSPSAGGVGKLERPKEVGDCMKTHKRISKSSICAENLLV